MFYEWLVMMLFGSAMDAANSPSTKTMFQEPMPDTVKRLKKEKPSD
ncbi:MAG: hypothetical protein K6A40_12855 [Solobacterium sp.]|nr:hypothetical protein [Solobacterium sp.]